MIGVRDGAGGEGGRGRERGVEVTDRSGVNVRGLTPHPPFPHLTLIPCLPSSSLVCCAFQQKYNTQR